jgi:hypothetical protein
MQQAVGKVQVKMLLEALVHMVLLVHKDTQEARWPHLVKTLVGVEVAVPEVVVALIQIR